jgi:hypothetical protein
MYDDNLKLPDTRAFLGTLFDVDCDVEAGGPVRGFIDRYEWGYSGLICVEGDPRVIAQLHGRLFRLETSVGFGVVVAMVSIGLAPDGIYSCHFRSRGGVTTGSFDDLDRAVIERIDDPADFADGPRPQATYRLGMPERLMGPRVYEPGRDPGERLDTL